MMKMLSAERSAFECYFAPRTDRPAINCLFALLLYEAAFYFAYRYGVRLGDATESPFWFPDAILLSALLITAPRWWWLVILAPLPIRFIAGTPDISPWLLLATFVVDSLKGIAAAILLRHLLENPIRFATVRDFILYCFAVVLLVPAIAACGDAAVRALRGYAYWSTWEQCFLGGALVNLIVTPIIFYWLLAAPWRGLTQLPQRSLEILCLTFGLVCSGYAAFSDASSTIGFTETRYYLPLLFMFWAALRFGMFGTTGATAIVTLLIVAAALEGHGPFSGQSPAQVGRTLQHFLMLYAAPLYFVAILVEQKKGVERVLRESERRFRHMANSAPALIWMSGTDDRCEFVNQAWLDFTGSTLERELGRHLGESIHPDERQQCSDIASAAFQARRPFELECRLHYRDGDYRWILSRAIPRYAESGDFLGYIGSAIDITERKRTEEMNQNIAHVSRLAVVGELTAMIAHEVNQPLGAILANAEAAELMLDTSDPPLEEIRQILSDIRRSDMRADEAIKRMRLLLRKHKLQMEPLDINQIVREVIRLVEGDLQLRHISLQQELCSTLPQVSGDRIYLQQVLLNLIVNALDAMRETPAAERRLVLRTRRSGGGVKVAVVDSGHGILVDDISTVFESFFTTKKDGVGLGLSISNSIIAMHNGKLWAENNAGGGATFRFVIPLAASVLSATAKRVESEQYGIRMHEG